MALLRTLGCKIFCSLFVLVCLSLFCGVVVNGEKILILSIFASKSHQNVFDPLLIELANRGHKVTNVSPVKSKPHSNIRNINGMTMQELIVEVSVDLFDMRERNVFYNPMGAGYLYDVVCRRYYEMPEVKELQNEKFDLIIVNSFLNECTYGLVHKINTTFMFLHPQAPGPWSYVITGAPFLPSFIPMPLLGFSHDMNFSERFLNSICQVALMFLNEYQLLPKVESIYRDYVGQDCPSVHHIEKKASLMLINSHISIAYPRPLMPDMIEVGGMHCRPGQPLPKDLEDFINGSGDEGFIYFSMGSVVPSHTMQEKYRKEFVNAFSKLKQRVIWKWETGEMPDTPKNALLGKWLPQQDILAHPKIRLFMTHGGSLSTNEAVYHGVPIIGIPIFSDQDWNMKQSEENGFALTLELRGLTQENITEAIHTVLQNPKFSERAKYLSKMYKDRPQKPLDTAIYWTEYVMRHKGAPHLRSPARELNYLQYFSIDVVIVAFLIIFTILYTFYRLVKILVWFFCGKAKSNVQLSKKNQ